MANDRKLFQKACFRGRERVQALAKSPTRKFLLRLQGASIGTGTVLPHLKITWPHQLAIGKNCLLECNIHFKFDGLWCPGPSIMVGNNVFLGNGCEFNIRQKIEIGDNCLIASGCKFIDHDHGIADLNRPMREQLGAEEPIRLMENVWLGVNVVVLKGVTIGTGAVVGAGAVCTKSIPANEIWGGVPAHKIGQRD